MRWIDHSLPPCNMACAYCATTGAFPHVKSFEHGGELLSLYACTQCASLIYDLAEIDAPIVSPSDLMSPEASRAARYVLEAGFSSYYVAMCGLSALPDVSPEAMRDYLFVDVGAGMGMASYFAKSVLGVETLTVEPSYTGGLAQKILGLEVHRAYFEDLPAEVLQRLANRSCLLHLNSVVEHLVDPLSVLHSILAHAPIETIAIIVPDGAALDFGGPFAVALPFLAPRDHRHLPTLRGLELLLGRLGFAYQAVQRNSGLLIGVGSRRQVRVPGEREIKLAETLLLENLLRHPHPHIWHGGGSRLLSVAVIKQDANLMAVLRSRFPYENDCDRILDLIGGGLWDEIPYHVGPSCYWLAYDAFSAGRPDGALALLDVSIAFADAIAQANPDFALTPLEFKWAALILRAHILATKGEPERATASLLRITDAASDAQNGPRQPYLLQAAAALHGLREAVPA